MQCPGQSNCWPYHTVPLHIVAENCAFLATLLRQLPLCVLFRSCRAMFRQLLAAGDGDVVQQVLKWVLSQGQLLEKRAFVGYYLSFPDVSVQQQQVSALMEAAAVRCCLLYNVMPAAMLQ